MELAWSLVVIFFSILASLYSFFHLLSFRTKYGVKRRLPSSPWGLPILGHFHMLGNLPHRNLHQLANKYGPIMSIRLGQVPTIVISSSPEWAELFLKTHDVVLLVDQRTRRQTVPYMDKETWCLHNMGHTGETTFVNYVP
ncbi:Cytochrome p450 [Thalictrum thalictroides]|uniref:Cytochrome p450 n=1 Tax=Thalictrum thalictroides TaxID=46969 RepID=A0A7J6V2W1_THATH|nr:Cytochrome p450 [Thalictrum thalictroides]